MKGSGPSLQTHQSPIPSKGDNGENRLLKQMVPATFDADRGMNNWAGSYGGCDCFMFKDPKP